MDSSLKLGISKSQGIPMSSEALYLKYYTWSFSLSGIPPNTLAYCLTSCPKRLALSSVPRMRCFIRGPASPLGSVEGAINPTRKEIIKQPLMRKAIRIPFESHGTWSVFFWHLKSSSSPGSRYLLPSSGISYSAPIPVVGTPRDSPMFLCL